MENETFNNSTVEPVGPPYWDERAFVWKMTYKLFDHKFEVKIPEIFLVQEPQNIDFNGGTGNSKPNKKP